MPDDPILSAVKEILFEIRPLLSLVRKRLELDINTQEEMLKRTRRPDSGISEARTVTCTIEPEAVPDEKQVTPSKPKPRMQGKPWNEDEIRLLLDRWKNHTLDEIAELMGRTRMSVETALSRIRTGQVSGFVIPNKENIEVKSQRRETMDLFSAVSENRLRKKWTEEDVSKLKSYIEKRWPDGKIAKILGRTELAIYKKRMRIQSAAELRALVKKW